MLVVLDEPLLPPPQAVRLPSAAIRIKAPSMARQLRRRAGMPKNTRRARTKPLPVPIHPLLPGMAWSMAVVAVVEMVRVAVPLAVPLVIVTVEPGEQEGT